MSAPHRPSVALERWIAFVQRHALAVVALALLIGVAATLYAKSHLSVDTNTAHMLSADLDWRKNSEEMDRLFPQGAHGIAVVVDGDTPEQAAQAQATLIAALRAQPQHFEGVFAIDAEPFFRRNGLLYLSQDELHKLSDTLVQAQPFLGTLNQDPSLHGLFTLLQRAETQGAESGADIAAQLGPALKQIGSGIEAVVAGKPYALSWQSLMGGGDVGGLGARRFIQVNAKLDFSQVLPAADAIAALRTLIADEHLDAAHGVRVRLTGSVPLEHEELLSAASGAGTAFAVGMLLVLVLLYIALRSGRLVVAALVVLVYGLLVTAALAALLVGHLNLISIAFGVLYVGLGIDYALYLCMQYRERIAESGETTRSLQRAAGDVGGFMAVCACTTSLGFLAFVPTSFTGIAELGLISGAGMFVSLVVSLSLLPALIHLLPPSPASVKLRAPTEGRIAQLLALPYTHARTLWIGAAVAAAIALVLAPRAHFDYDPLHLRDPHSESVSTFKDLLKDPSLPTLTLSSLAKDQTEADALPKKLAALPLVRNAMSLADFVPKDQDDKLAAIEDLNFTLGPELLLNPATTIKADDTADLAALASLRETLAGDGKGEAEQALKRALDALQQRYDGLDAQGRSALLTQLRSALLGTLPQRLGELRDALSAKPVTLADLPESLRQRWIAADGRWRVEIWPKEVMDNNEAMQRFVDQVRASDPQATGAPIEWLESGRAVVHSFRQAFAYSVVAITLLLLVLLRSFKDTLLVLIPLVLAGLLTVGGAVLAGLSFNFANVIALPLILGVGVDYGVYIVQRGRAAATAGQHINLLQTSTARAVLFGALITVANFGNLALSSHPGTRSMGILLTVGLSMTLLCALVLLPSMMVLRRGQGPGTRGQ